VIEAAIFADDDDHVLDRRRCGGMILSGGWGRRSQVGKQS